ncbi:chemotaxis protein CheB [Sphingomonas sp.]|uniref:chemotaxis protein CheB n=1 Tax=Sphingomonas sp. TaxID=28214 RepID=UPI001D750B1E|nr:chemotaxis protein CheB [Sphingomonas sp.]MBX9795691.1 response regulator [Sphingomonas sp.]
MPAIKVLVVDDSLTMRALFTSALERSKDIVVVGAAGDAAEARQLIEELKPNVVTLDVEMPGMNGLDFLAEIMDKKPMPVIMLSTLTHKGGDVSLRALEIGAVDCFPKPARATPDEFEKISGKLCKLVITASKTNVAAKKVESKPASAIRDYRYDGAVIGIAGGMGGPDAALEMLARYPANCPPTILMLPMDEGLVVPFGAKLARAVAAEVKIAADGVALHEGHIYIASAPTHHVVVDRWPGGMIRMVDREPVNGARPSPDMLFATLAKVAGLRAGGVMLSGGGADGAAGLAAIAAAGGRAIVQDPATALIAEGIEAVRARLPEVKTLAAADIAPALLERISLSAAA